MATTTTTADNRAADHVVAVQIAALNGALTRKHNEGPRETEIMRCKVARLAQESGYLSGRNEAICSLNRTMEGERHSLAASDLYSDAIGAELRKTHEQSVAAYLAAFDAEHKDKLDVLQAHIRELQAESRAYLSAQAAKEEDVAPPSGSEDSEEELADD
jgi:hypothetical protein